MLRAARAYARAAAACCAGISIMKVINNENNEKPMARS